jgi:hypothetical protein
VNPRIPVLLISFPVAVALAAAFSLYVSISFGQMMVEILRGFGLHVDAARLGWDDWFRAAIAAASALGAIGISLRKQWALLVGSGVLGVSFGRFLAMSVLPEIYLENWFAFKMDRWPAAGVTLVFSVFFGWLGSRRGQLALSNAQVSL